MNSRLYSRGIALMAIGLAVLVISTFMDAGGASGIAREMIDGMSRLGVVLPVLGLVFLIAGLIANRRTGKPPRG